MAVTTPEVLRPDSLTVTISQVPGVSPTWETGWGGKEVGSPARIRGGQLPLLLCFSHSSRAHPPALNFMQPRPLLSYCP